MQVQTINETFQAGETKTFYIGFSFFQLLGCLGNVTVKILKRGAGGGTAVNVPQSFTWQAPPGDLAQGVEIYSATAQTVVALLTDGESKTNVIGGRTVVDGVVETAPDFSRVIKGQAFMGPIGSPAVAAQYAHAQLFNPAASGKNVIVTRLRFSPYAAPSTDTIAITFHDTALTTLVGTVPSKLFGGAVSTSEMRKSSHAAPQGTLLGYSAIGSIVEFGSPFVISEGGGLTFYHAGVNLGFVVTAEFFEEDI